MHTLFLDVSLRKSTKNKPVAKGFCVNRERKDWEPSVLVCICQTYIRICIYPYLSVYAKHRDMHAQIKIKIFIYKYIHNNKNEDWPIKLNKTLVTKKNKCVFSLK